jgi:NAD(P)-dependent dehydrogenase (short-subunit alcohol dehydrogenase family)
MKKPTYLAPVLATSAVAALAVALLPRPARLRRGQVAILTGGSRGLGLALAHEFGSAGLKLVLAARHRDELEQARIALLSGRPDTRTNAMGRPSVAHEDDILLVDCDLTDPAQAAGLVEATIKTFGRLDVIVNNAGIIEVGPVENQPLAAYERAMQTNFFAALYTIHAALPYLLNRPDKAHRAIVNISSVGGKIAVPHLLPYVAAKFALTGFSEGLHAELRLKGVRVTTVCPGLMRTGGEVHASFVGQQAKEQRWFDFGAKTPGIAAPVESAARQIVRAVQAGRAEITITPQAWLAARLVGVAPEASQVFAALVNQFLLPDALPEREGETAAGAESLAGLARG